MRGRTPLALAVGVSAVALVAAGCTSTPSEGGTDSIAITVNWSEPENPLIPANTTETQGGIVIDSLFTGLVEYDTKTGEPVLANAESIEPDATSTTYTIKLKPGWKWHDGTDVVAQDYVDAWNDAAYAPNGMANASFFADILGYDEVNPGDESEPTAQTMRGLKVIDDLTFEVTLKGPSNLWPVKLGYSAFSPLPKAYFADKDAFVKNPIGNGPFKYVSRQENVELRLTRYDEYQGEKPQITDIIFKVYQDDNAAYADVQAGTLDFMQQVPSADLQGNKYANDFPNTSANTPVAVSELVAIPFYRPEYQNVKLRQALSVAIDRQTITQRIFNGTRIPMKGWVNPKVSGFQEGACGKYCEYDPDFAKQLLQEGNVTVNPDGSFVSNGVTVPMITIQYNADASHKDWVDATCVSITQATGIKCEGKPIPTFAESRTIIDNHEATSLFRSGWQADYPSIENWLNPLLRTGASSNDGLFSDAAFDAKLAEADATQDIKEAEALYREAEAMLPDLMPTIPMWHRAQQSVWSERLQEVPINIFGELDFVKVRVKV
ncbi:MAG: ABC transporter substrate-binding protein [Micromonosporaceae bacterium]|nr:ABC transporter substrate-binding protein [Micromonosporaceae bacterium]